LTGPGFAIVDDVGFPPGKLQLYVKPPAGLQALTDASGFIEPAPHILEIGLMDASGGLATVTVWDNWVLPQVLDIVNVIVYVPGSVKVKDALGPVCSGITLIGDPQNPAACETVHVLVGVLHTDAIFVVLIADIAKGAHPAIVLRLNCGDRGASTQIVLVIVSIPQREPIFIVML